MRFLLCFLLNLLILWFLRFFFIHLFVFFFLNIIFADDGNKISAIQILHQPLELNIDHFLCFLIEYVIDDSLCLVTDQSYVRYLGLWYDKAFELSYINVKIQILEGVFFYVIDNFLTYWLSGWWLFFFFQYFFYRHHIFSYM